MSVPQLPSAAQLREIARRFEKKDPSELLHWAIATYHPRIVLACSFGGPTGMVLLDMLMQIDRSIPVYYLDTGVLFEQTHDLIERVARRYTITPLAVFPPLTLSEQSALYAPELWGLDPDLCCNLRKVEPQRAFLSNYDAWFTGLRRSQSETRVLTPVIEWDETFGLAKLNPLAAWDDRMVWAYVNAHNVPYNTLNAQGFPSVGCTPCTRAIGANEDVRAGRWTDFEKVECGIHSRLRPHGAA